MHAGWDVAAGAGPFHPVDNEVSEIDSFEFKSWSTQTTFNEELVSALCITIEFFIGVSVSVGGGGSLGGGGGGEFGHHVVAVLWGVGGGSGRLWATPGVCRNVNDCLLVHSHEHEIVVEVWNSGLIYT